MGPEFRLALTQESMHALGERVAKARPMPILESNHKTEKSRALEKNERTQESQRIKDNGHMALNAQFTS